MNEPQQAYDRIIGPIEDRMIRSLWRIVRNADDAEDAMQDALMTIWKRWDRIVTHPVPEALVLKFCVDAAYDITRRRVRDRRSHAIDEPLESVCSPPQEAIDRELYAEVIAAIHRLSRQQAVATLMRIVQEQSYQHIAAALGCTEATARTHVARGRNQLRLSLSHLDPAKARGDSQ